MTSDPPASQEAESTPISERFARVALAIERYVLPWIYVGFVYFQVKAIHASYENYQGIVRSGLHTVSLAFFWAEMTRNILLCVLASLIALTLFVSRRPTHLPKNLAHISVPLAMSYYFFLYRALDFMPGDLRENLLPYEWRVPVAGVAVFLAAIGCAVSLWGLVYLRRSFALLVAVRDVVSGGPYAYVRHPMYMGYIIELAGLVLSSFSLGMMLLAGGFLLLTVTRAHLEEARLVEASPEYRDYMKRTGFLFPRFFARPEAPTA